jgi:indole-3-glycerol phosphate synthase
MTTAVKAPDLLAAIVGATRRIVEVRSDRVSRSSLERSAAAVAARPGVFKAALTRDDRVNVIAECKRRSPSRGVLRSDYDPVAIAKAYDEAGAAAISVLTEPTFFDGSLDHLAAVRQATLLPILRKDFIVDSYQILEARAAGADAVLLIVAAIEADVLARLHRDAVNAGLDVLVEVHDASEVRVALDAGAQVIGVNNRNLRTLDVDTSVSGKVIELIPDDIVAVAESGLKTSADVQTLRAAGYDAFLVGERFMVADDPGRGLRELL